MTKQTREGPKQPVRWFFPNKNNINLDQCRVHCTDTVSHNILKYNISPVTEICVLVGEFGTKSFFGIALFKISSCLPPKKRNSGQVGGSIQVIKT